MTMFLDLVRNLLGLLDSLIYGFVDTVYVTFTTIASYTLVNSEIINNFATRIYSLIGIFMLFKMLFSLITYFIDPDKLVDQKAGFGNLVQRTIVSLVLLILVPYIFQLAFHAQTIILEQNILANVVLGGEYSSISTEERLDSYNHAGQKMSFAVLSAFFHPKDVNVLTMSEEDLKKNYDGDELQALQEYRRAAKDFDVGALLEWGGIKNKENDDGYIFSYTMVISTIGGALVLWMMFLFCIDIGVRAVKLSFLQLIAPIPVLSYIDAQEGYKIFNRWVKECVSTYLEVFVKLLIIYFVVFLITILTKDGFTIYEYQLSGGDLVTKKVTDGDLFAQALIILGLLMFAGQAPKLIGDLFGVKMGDFSLNPMKKIGASPLASGIIGGAIGGGLSMAGNIYGNYARNKQLKADKDSKKISDEEYNKYHRSLGNQFRSAVGGLGSGAFRGARSSASSKDFLKGSIQGAKASTQARKARAEGMKGINAARNLWTDISGQEGSTGTVNELKDKIKVNTQKMEQAERKAHMYEHAMSQMMGSEGGKYASQFSDIYANEYSNFGEYLMSNDAYKKDYDKIMNDTNYTEKEKEQLTQALQSDSEKYGLVNEQLFEQFTSAKSGMLDAIEEKKRLEKDITRLKETKDINKQNN